MLDDVRAGGTLSGGTKVRKSGVAVRRRNKTSYMEGPEGKNHGLDGVIHYSRNKSLYGGEADFQGGAMSGGAVIGGFLPILAGIASAVAPALISTVASKMFGSGSNGKLTQKEVKELHGGVAHAVMPVLTSVATRLAKRGRGVTGGMVTGGTMRGIGEVVHTGGPSAMGKHLGSSRGGVGFEGGGFDGSGGAYAKGMGGRSRRSSSGAKARAKTNPWLQHVAEFRKDHPGVAYKDILKMAKKTY